MDGSGFSHEHVEDGCKGMCVWSLVAENQPDLGNDKFNTLIVTSNEK